MEVFFSNFFTTKLHKVLKRHWDFQIKKTKINRYNEECISYPQFTKDFNNPSELQLQSEWTDCCYRGNDLQFERTDCVNQINELQFEKMDCFNRENELQCERTNCLILGNEFQSNRTDYVNRKNELQSKITNYRTRGKALLINDNWFPIRENGLYSL